MQSIGKVIHKPMPVVSCLVAPPPLLILSGGSLCSACLASTPEQSPVVEHTNAIQSSEAPPPIRQGHQVLPRSNLGCRASAGKRGGIPSFASWVFRFQRRPTTRKAERRLVQWLYEKVLEFWWFLCTHLPFSFPSSTTYAPPSPFGCIPREIVSSADRCTPPLNKALTVCDTSNEHSSTVCLLIKRFPSGAPK